MSVLYVLQHTKTEETRQLPKGIYKPWGCDWDTEFSTKPTCFSMRWQCREVYCFLVRIHLIHSGYGRWCLGQMENEAITKPRRYSLSELSSIRKINTLTISLEMNSKKMIHAEGGFRMSNIYDLCSGGFGISCVQESRSLGNLDNRFWCAGANASSPRASSPNKRGWIFVHREYFIVA